MVNPQIECAEISDKYGRFITEPLERGYGITIGNAMRRVLLSSLPGAAITWVSIEGVQHEFSTVPHMKEDTIEFMLNVKKIRLRPLSSSGGKLNLRAEGEGNVLAGDIEPSAEFEVVNPDLHLATLDFPEAKLIVEFNVEQGKGYRPAIVNTGGKCHTCILCSSVSKSFRTGYLFFAKAASSPSNLKPSGTYFRKYFFPFVKVKYAYAPRACIWR